LLRLFPLDPLDSREVRTVQFQLNQLKELVKRKKLENVRFLPYLPPDALPYSFGAGDIAIVSMKPGTEGLCVPSKLYTALASGSAIVGIVTPNTEVADLIEREQCGLRANPGDPEEIAGAILRLHEDHALLEQCRRNARSCFERYFTKERNISQFYSPSNNTLHLA